MQKNIHLWGGKNLLKALCLLNYYKFIDVIKVNQGHILPMAEAFDIHLFYRKHLE